LAQLKASLEQKPFEPLRQQWHQNQQTLSETCGRLAEIDELQGQFNRMISMLDQKCEALEKMFTK
jgi:HAMP domain-containing protein